MDMKVKQVERYCAVVTRGNQAKGNHKMVDERKLENGPRISADVSVGKQQQQQQQQQHKGVATDQSPTAILIGAGCRGHIYASYAYEFPHRLKIVGVAEPRDFHRNRLVERHHPHIRPENVFRTWQEAAARDKMADIAIIATPDRLHRDPALAFAREGYHILLEKPIAVSVEECTEVVASCKENGRMLAVCHVLRYMPLVRHVKQMIDSDVIGDVVSIQHLEPIGPYRFTHSFVRGNWRNEAQSTFSLLSKSCHDIDLIVFLTGTKKCTAISSFGGLHHFKKENKSRGAGSRCMSCPVERSCQWSAKKIYLDEFEQGGADHYSHVITDVPDIENITEALTSGPYGRCVYECDNDVVDNQVVNMQFEGGTTVSFTMLAFNNELRSRFTRIFGTKGELRLDMNEPFVTHIDFRTGKTVKREVQVRSDGGSSRSPCHCGANFYAMDAFITAVQTDDQSKILTGPEESLRSHLLTFAAEQSRRENRVILNPE